MFQNEARMQAAIVFGPVLVGLSAALVAPKLIADETTLARLGKCLTELRASHESTITSPCAFASATGVVGVDRTRVREILGEPDSCSEPSARTNGRECDNQAVWRYSFYRLEGLGGGPELFVRFSGGTVEATDWWSTQ